MPTNRLPELWQWTEYYCPWSYIAAVRLDAVRSDFRDRVTLRIRPFPLEVVGGGPPNRDELEQEWWLAAIQEPRAAFGPFRGDDWPTTTLPAFEGVRCAQRQGGEFAYEFDLRVRSAFFAESRNIGRREVILAIARDSDLDFPRFERDFGDASLREEVLAEGRAGYDQFGVRGTPTLMLEDGTLLEIPMAEPHFEDGKVAAVKTPPCIGQGCNDAVRAIFERAARQSRAQAAD